MPYCRNFDHPKKDDVVWGNDGMLPLGKMFDTANPPEGLNCTLGDDKHEEIAAGYIFDPLIGWNLACYDHCMICLDSDLRNDNHFLLLQGVLVPRQTGRQRLEQEKKAVPEGASCDNPHDKLPDAPPAVCGVFVEKKPPKFYCEACIMRYVHDTVIMSDGQFEAFEVIAATRKKEV